MRGSEEEAGWDVIEVELLDRKARVEMARILGNMAMMCDIDAIQACIERFEADRDSSLPAFTEAGTSDGSVAVNDQNSARIAVSPAIDGKCKLVCSSRCDT